MTDQEFQQRVLGELKELREGQDDLRKEMREGLDDVKGLIAGLSATVVTVPKLRRELRDRLAEEVS